MYIFLFVVHLYVGFNLVRRINRRSVLIRKWTLVRNVVTVKYIMTLYTFCNSIRAVVIYFCTHSHTHARTWRFTHPCFLFHHLHIPLPTTMLNILLYAYNLYVIIHSDRSAYKLSCFVMYCGVRIAGLRRWWIMSSRSPPDCAKKHRVSE